MFHRLQVRTSFSFEILCSIKVRLPAFFKATQLEEKGGEIVGEIFIREWHQQHPCPKLSIVNDIFDS